MADFALNIFDQFGGVSNNLSETEIAKCSPEQQAILFPLLTAWTDTQEEDLRCLAVEANKRKAMTALDKAEKILIEVTPKWTAHDEWKRTVARLPQDPPDAAVVKKIKAATAVRDAAEEYLGECVAEVLPAQALRNGKRKLFADLLKKWIANDGSRPRSAADLIKARIRTETAQKMENLKNGFPADYVEHAASTVGPCYLDQMRAGMGKGSSADYGHNANRMRGAQLPMKTPSER